MTDPPKNSFHPSTGCCCTYANSERRFMDDCAMSQTPTTSLMLVSRQSNCSDKHLSHAAPSRAGWQMWNMLRVQAYFFRRSCTRRRFILWLVSTHCIQKLKKKESTREGNMFRIPSDEMQRFKGRARVPSAFSSDNQSPLQEAAAELWHPL